MGAQDRHADAGEAGRQLGRGEQAAKLGGSAPVLAGDPVAVREKLMELVELGFDYSIATFPQFQELDDMKLFVAQVLPHFS